MTRAYNEMSTKLAATTERSLIRSETRFRRLVEQAAEGFFVLDREARICEVNHRACEVLGYEREALRGRSMAEISVELDFERHRRFCEELDPGATATVDAVHRRKDGTAFPVEVRLSGIDLDGERRILALARNVTEREAQRRA